ncbi:unnamed protein product [Malus baccata var. baccata]
MGNYKFISPLFFFSYLCMHAFVLNSCLSLALARSNGTDKLALLEFKARITTDPFGVMSSWNETIHFCQWHGVTCGHRHERITMLTLRSLKLGGSISPHVGNLSFLREFNLLNNSFSQEIPPEIGRLRRLQVSALQNNSLSGEIPANLSGCSELNYIYVSGNLLEGSIPKELGSLSKLKKFNIAVNHHTGSIPYTFSNISSLEAFGASFNNLGGIIPDIFGRLTNFYFLGLEGNDLSSNSCPSLRTFAISYNKFRGTIPVAISNASNLFELGLNGNQLHGEVPSLKNLHKLGRFVIGLNHLGSGGTGDDLSFLCDLTNATANLSSSFVYFYVAYNSIFGDIPNVMENFPNLESIWLSGNHFSVYMETNSLTGNLPSSFGNLSRLTDLHLEDNNLQGTIPSTLSQCPNLVNLLLHFEVSRNLLSCEIPPSLGSCKTIHYLDLQENFFQGTIPSDLSSLRGIETLSLACNNLSGTIPKFLENFTFLQSLNLSYNNLEGAVPIEGVFRNATATSVQGNTKLCGGIPEFQLPKCEFRHSSKRGLNLTLKLPFFSFAVLYLCCFRSKKKEDPSTTDGFSSANLIGMGSFGSVYKGLLDQGETTIAIKVLNLDRHGASKSFIAECEALKNIRHCNLMKVLSACSGFDYCGSKFKALIYEFMTSIDTNQRPRSLTFSQRLNIAIDVAMALDYLHHQCHMPIVHCDLKPINVLLDNDMIGHVGDFGLARFLPRTVEDGFGNQSSSFRVKGTIGYTPPEYGMGHEVWPQGDVYSYGILLLEMFTGKRPTGDMFQGSSNLHNYVKAALPELVLDIVDPVLIQEKVEGELSANQHLTEASTTIRRKIEESLISVLGVGVACSADMPGERLGIVDAMARMCRIRNRLRADKILGKIGRADLVSSVPGRLMKLPMKPGGY